MAMIMFGAGRLYGTRQDVANATPIEFATLQEVTPNFSFDTKDLVGSNQFPIFVARGTAKWTLTAKMGTISGRLFNDLFFGQTMSSGQTAAIMGEAGGIPASTPYTYTVANAVAMTADLGVVYAGSGRPLTKVSSAPTTNQYSVNVVTGVYTFAAGDANTSILVSYLYGASGGGQTITLTNAAQGVTPYFSGVFRNRDAKTGLFETYVFNRLTSTKLGLGAKISDYDMASLDIQVMADDAGNIGTMSFGESS